MSGNGNFDDFDLGFQEDEDQEPQYGANTEILPETPFMKQQRIKTSIHGVEAQSFGGRMTSPKLYYYI